MERLHDLLGCFVCVGLCVYIYFLLAVAHCITVHISTPSETQVLLLQFQIQFEKTKCSNLTLQPKRVANYICIHV